MHKQTWRRGAIALLGVVATSAGLIAVTSSPASGARPLAQAVLQNATGDTVGKVTFLGRNGQAESVKVSLNAPETAPGLGAFHGLHLHTTGVCAAPFTTAGGHWNLATGQTHGNHTGDLPSILIGPDGKASLSFDTHRFEVSQLFDADGSAVILHMGPDNFGNVPITAGKYEDPNNWYNNVDPAGTARTGDAGSRYACGVVTAS